MAGPGACAAVIVKRHALTEPVRLRIQRVYRRKTVLAFVWHGVISRFSLLAVGMVMNASSDHIPAVAIHVGCAYRGARKRLLKSFFNRASLECSGDTAQSEPEAGPTRALAPETDFFIGLFTVTGSC